MDNPILEMESGIMTCVYYPERTLGQKCIKELFQNHFSALHMDSDSDRSETEEITGTGIHGV